MFKKKKLKSIKKSNWKFIKVIGLFAIVWIFVLALVVINRVSDANFNVYKTFLNPANEVKNFLTLSPEEKQKLALAKIQKDKLEAKEENDAQKTNILIIWRWGYWNDAPELTDSIILASINKKKNYITMLSVPRDLYVNYGDYSKSWKKISGKINGLYVHYLSKFQDEEKAVKKLEEKITEISWEKIDHYVNIDFNGFIKLVDAIGWVQIDVPKTLVDHKYPDNNHGYQSFILRKWNWLLDWKVALKYTRSRKNTGWDFGRSERQQQIISALKDKILSWNTLSSPSKIKKFYNIYNKYLSTNISLSQAISLFSQMKLQEDTKVYSSGLNTSCSYEKKCEKWWYLYYPQRSYFGWMSVLLPESSDNKNLDNYTDILKYTDIVFNSPKLFEEKYKISIFSKLKDKKDAQLLRDELKKIWLEINTAERIWNIPEWSVWNTISTNPKKRLNLEQYNQQKAKTRNINNSSNNSNNNWIWIESNNNSTKIIINWVDTKSETLSYLKNYFQITDDDIIENLGWPKYAQDPNTQIEIIYTQ